MGRTIARHLRKDIIVYRDNILYFGIKYKFIIEQFYKILFQLVFIYSGLYLLCWVWSGVVSTLRAPIRGCNYSAGSGLGLKLFCWPRTLIIVLLLIQLPLLENFFNHIILVVDHSLLRVFDENISATCRRWIFPVAVVGNFSIT